MEEKIIQKLKEVFWEHIEVDFYDEKGDGKHFYLDITSEKFIWKSRVEQSQMVYACLNDFMKTWYIHALRMKCKVPNNN